MLKAQESPVAHVDVTNEEAQADTERMLPHEGAAHAALTAIASELGEDELRVLSRIAERLKGGQASYGRLSLATDARSFRSKEAREDVEDALVYLACAWLQTDGVSR